MIETLRSVRLTRVQLGAVGVISTLASALIITSAMGRSAAQSAAIAALSHRGVPARSAPAGSTDPPTSAAVPVVAAAAPVTGAGSSAGSGSSPGGGSGGSGSTGSGSGTTTTTTTTSTTSTTTAAPKHTVGHVFVIALSTPSFEAAWGQTSAARYLNHTLKPRGAFLGGYQTLGTSELPDYLALVSGQAPNADTNANCATYSEFPPNTKPAANGQVPGNGCVYPNTILTIADQVTARGKLWRGYIDDLAQSTCVHPNSGAVDNAQLAGAGKQYATRHNPFIYFHSLLDLGGCSANDVSVTQLPQDLASPRSTPRYSLIAPGACDEGSAPTCPGGTPAGIAGEDAFLRRWVPVIERSAAYEHDGVIVIVFALSGAAPGGGSAPTGALVLSPFAPRGKTISATYDPYSILRGSEDLLGYQPLGHAKSAKSFATQTLPGT